MNVGIYVRVSTEEQRDFGYSIEGYKNIPFCKCKIRFAGI